MDDYYINNDKILNKLSEDISKNHKVLKKFSNNPTYILEESIYRLGKEKEDKLLLILKTLFTYGFSPNSYADKDNNNYIKRCILDGYSEDFIIKALKLGLKYGLDINQINNNFNNILTIFWDEDCKYEGNILNIYNLLKEKGFDIFICNKNYKKNEEVISKHKDNIYDSQEFYNTLLNDKKEQEETKINNLIYLCNKLSDVEILNYLSTINIDENISFKVLEYFIKKRIDVNARTNPIIGRIFIEDAMIHNHSDEYIFKIIELAINYGLNINHINLHNETILHVYANQNCERRILPLYHLLRDNDFNFNLKDNTGKSVYYSIRYKKNGLIDVLEFEKEYELNNKGIGSLNKIRFKNEEDMKYLENISSQEFKNTDYYNINYNKIPHNLYYLSKPILLLEGKKGVGKSTLLNNLVFDIYQYYYKEGFITNVKDIIKKCKSISSFKNELLVILKKCITNGLTLFIDDFDDIYNFSDIDIEQIEILLKHYIENYGLKIIGTFQFNDKTIKKIDIEGFLEKYIDYHYINEPNNNELKEIIESKMERKLYEEGYNVSLGSTKEYLTALLLYLNSINENNEFSILKILDDILDNINVYCKKVDTIISKSHIIYALRHCNYIDEKIKNIIIKELIKTENVISHKDLNDIKKKIK